MTKTKKNNGPRTIKNEVMIALDDIHEKYKRLLSTHVEKFAPVYYPIAMIEMNLDELTFEDFESVQFAVLNLVSLGIADYKVIADTLGLSQNYVFKIIRLLNGYGHMDENGITDIGRESINCGKKIVQSQVWQKFQVDALNGTLLKVEQAVTENMLNDREQTQIMIGHLNYMDGMSMEDISSQLTKNNCNSYIRQKSSILNTNVTKINDIRCIEVKYAKCYMMKMRDCDDPIIFAKRYDSKQKEVKERFSWEPFSVKNEAVREKFGFEDDVPCSTDIAKKYVGQLYSMLTERASKVDLVEEIKRTMECIYPFEEPGVEMGRTSGVIVPVVNISEAAFMKYRSWILNFLIGIHRDGEYLITHERLYGNVISLRTESLFVMDVADLLVQKIEKDGKIGLMKEFRDKFRDYDGKDNVIALIDKELRLKSQ